VIDVLMWLFWTLIFEKFYWGERDFCGKLKENGMENKETLGQKLGQKMKKF
jgi:hypothetical protein